MMRILTIILIAFTLSCKDKDAITTLWGPSGELLEDGREYRWWAGGYSNNDKDSYRALILTYYATPGRDRLKMKEGITYSIPQALPNIKGNATITQKYPPNSQVSGLTINGSKQKLEEGLNVVFLSNLTEPQKFVVKSEKVDEFINNLRNEEWDNFFTEHVMPRIKNWKEANPKTD